MSTRDLDCGDRHPATSAGIDRLLARIRELSHRAAREMETTVIGARGEELTVSEAVERARMLDGQIQVEEMRGSRRHRPVSRAAKISAVLILAITDFPVMLWLTAAVFNVNWSRPWGLPLGVSVVITILATGGSAATLYHLGHNLRENKNAQGGLDWRGLSIGSRLSVLGVVALVLLIAAVMMVRLYSEGVLSGIAELAFLLALLVSLVMLISAGLVFRTALRDGSPERDDLMHYSQTVERHRRIVRGYENEAVELTHRCELLQRHPRPFVPGVPAGSSALDRPGSREN